MVMPSENLFIGDLPGNIDDATLSTIFSAYGTIKSFKVLQPSSRGSGNAVISFGSVEEATWIVQNLNGNIPQGLTSPVAVSFKQDNKGKAGCKGVASFQQPGMGWQGGVGATDGWQGCGANGGWQGGGGDAGWQGEVINELSDPRGMGMDMGMGMGGKGSGMMGMSGGMFKGAEEPSANLFIGDLPEGCDDQMLLSILGAYGTVKSHKLTTPGSSGKCAAVVTFGSLEEAKWIVENLNGNIPQGMTTPIVARYKKDSKGKGKEGGGAWGGCGMGAGAWGGGGMAVGGFDGGYGACMGGGMACGGGNPQSDSLFVGDLPVGIDDATLLAIFNAYGTVKSHKILPPGTTGAAAIISFATPDEAKWLVDNLNGNIPQGLTGPIKVRFKDAKGSGKGGPYSK